MIPPWPLKRMKEIADIRISNVDKKSCNNENAVRLCNYMDVYSNEYITDDIVFMEATARAAEIERFRVKIGDVLITKDSETPDDIGIPAVINDNIQNILCGYHLALIRPNSDIVDSIFLAKQLSSANVRTFFSLHATGSTRYGLPVSTIESVEIPLPLKIEQSKIADILSTVDRAIDQTEALIAKQQRIKTGLMQDLLTKGIDENGNLRSEETHEFKDSPLGRIPVEWEVKILDNVSDIKYGISDAIDTMNKNGIPTITLPCISPDGKMDLSILKIVYTPKKNVKDIDLLMYGDLLFNWRNGSKNHLGKTAFFNIHDEYTHVGFLLRIRAKSDSAFSKFLWYIINYIKENGYFLNAKIQVNNTFNSHELKSVALSFPSIVEQKAICERLDSLEYAIINTTIRLEKLRSLKTALMQDLLTGKVRVTSLLDDGEAGV